MAKAHLRLVTPTIVNRTVTPRRPPNKDLRTREHLTEAEVRRLIKATQGNRYGHRDSTMVLMAYCHGLRAAELIDAGAASLPWPPQHPAHDALHRTVAHAVQELLVGVNSLLDK